MMQIVTYTTQYLNEYMSQYQQGNSVKRILQSYNTKFSCVYVCLSTIVFQTMHTTVRKFLQVTQVV